jgi:hypothetical protein
MMPPETRENIENIKRILGVDIIFGDHDMRNNVSKMIKRWSLKPSAGMVGGFCVGCMTGINRGLSEVAAEYNVGLIMHGGGGELPQMGSTFPLQILASSMDTTKTRLATGFAKELIKNPRYLTNASLLAEIGKEAYYRFVWNPRSQMDMVVLGLYSFIEWNEDTITDTIKRELEWQRPANCTNDWRTDCRLHRFKEYLYLGMLGFTKNDVLLSCIIRRGEITRGAALTRLRNDNAISEDFIRQYCVDMKLDWPLIQRIANTPILSE